MRGGASGSTAGVGSRNPIMILRRPHFIPEIFEDGLLHAQSKKKYGGGDLPASGRRRRSMFHRSKIRYFCMYTLASHRNINSR